MRINLNGIVVFLFYLITMAVGSLTIISTNWNELQLFVGITFISLTFFILINVTTLKSCLLAIINKPILSINMCASLCLMLLPIFYTQKHGVSTVFYSLMFSIVIAQLGFFFAKKYLCSLALLILMVILIIYDKHDIYHYLTPLGPIGAYAMLRSAKKVAEVYNMNTSQLMCFRYIMLGIVGVVLCPFLHFQIAMFNSIEVSKVFLIAFFMNIIPIYCSQYVALKIGPNFLSQGVSLLPLVTFLVAYIFYQQSFNNIELIYSVLITAPLLLTLGKYILKDSIYI